MRDEDDLRSPQPRPALPEPQAPGGDTHWRALGAILVIATEALFLVPSRPNPPQVSRSVDELAAIEDIASPEAFDELCADMWSSDRRFEACRRKLPVLQNTYRWVDTALLVKQGETLGLNHLGLFYGVTAPEHEATRLALAAILGAQCRGGLPLGEGEKTFEQLYLPRCRGKLPTLAQLGLVLDEAHGVQPAHTGRP